jgi:hypothetical protein
MRGLLQRPRSAQSHVPGPGEYRVEAAAKGASSKGEL